MDEKQRSKIQSEIQKVGARLGPLMEMAGKGLHETVTVSPSMIVQRVAGGWLYFGHFNVGSDTVGYSQFVIENEKSAGERRDAITALQGEKLELEAQLDAGS